MKSKIALALLLSLSAHAEPRHGFWTKKKVLAVTSGVAGAIIAGAAAHHSSSPKPIVFSVSGCHDGCLTVHK